MNIFEFIQQARDNFAQQQAQQTQQQQVPSMGPIGQRIANGITQASAPPPVAGSGYVQPTPMNLVPPAPVQQQGSNDMGAAGTALLKMFMGGG